MKQALISIVQGMAIGVANLIPGISGGTLAVILGIYEKLIGSVKDLFTFSIEKIKENIKFLVTIGTGAILGILLFSRVIELGLTRAESQTMMFFFGLVLGSIPVVFKMSKISKISVGVVTGFFATTIIMVALFLFSLSISNIEPNAQQDHVLTTLPVQMRLLLAGFIAGGAMIMPGISGSLILLILGMYGDIISAISSFNMPLLGFTAIGAILGIFACSAAISWLFKRYHDIGYAIVIGFLTGSLLTLWPLSFEFNSTGFFTIICGVCGLSVSYLINKIS